MAQLLCLSTLCVVVRCHRRHFRVRAKSPAHSLPWTPSRTPAHAAVSLPARTTIPRRRLISQDIRQPRRRLPHARPPMFHDLRRPHTQHSIVILSLGERVAATPLCLAVPRCGRATPRPGRGIIPIFRQHCYARTLHCEICSGCFFGREVPDRQRKSSRTRILLVGSHVRRVRRNSLQRTAIVVVLEDTTLPSPCTDRFCYCLGFLISCWHRSHLANTLVLEMATSCLLGLFNNRRVNASSRLLLAFHLLLQSLRRRSYDNDGHGRVLQAIFGNGSGHKTLHTTQVAAACPHDKC